MGYIDYCLEYDNGETWGETKPFWDMADYGRLSSNEFIEVMTEYYRAKQVYIVAVRTTNEELSSYLMGRHSYGKENT